MNPIVFSFGPLTLRAFTAWIMVGAAIGAVLILRAARHTDRRYAPWVDCLIGGGLGALIGARAFHVGLHWNYFSAHLGEALQLSAGGLNWHGALTGGLFACLLTARLRKVPTPPLLDALALAFPIMAAAGWRACVDAACGYGLEVRSLADYPALLVTESPDIYGTLAPRLNLPLFGILLSGLLLALVVFLSRRRWLGGRRLWLAITLFSLGMFFISAFRAEYVPLWAGFRADQMLDLIMTIGFGLRLMGRA